MNHLIHQVERFIIAQDFPLVMIDEEDLKILKELRKDSRLTTRETGKKTGISAATVSRRLNKLVKEGFIKRFTIEPDWKKIGFSVLAYVLINVDYHDAKKRKSTQDFTAQELKKHPLVFDSCTITGSKDMVLKIRAKDNEELHNLINYLRSFEGVLSTETLVVLYEASDHDNVFEKG